MESAGRGCEELYAGRLELEGGCERPCPTGRPSDAARTSLEGVDLGVVLAGRSRGRAGGEECFGSVVPKCDALKSGPETEATVTTELKGYRCDKKMISFVVSET